jgi:polysaccharide export outer membrane protein
MKCTMALAALAAATVLGGCVFAPGQNFSKNGLMRNEDASRYFQVVPITPKLLAMDAATRTSASTVPQSLLDYQPGPYRIGPGDTLYVTVWEHPELTAPAGSQQQLTINSRLVRSDGTLYYPFVGTVKVAGMTLEDLRKLISQKLAPYIPSPQVDVGVTGYASQHVTLSGAFQDTTPQPVTSVPLTLAQAIGTAKIDAENANRSDLVLTRDGHRYRLDIDAIDDDDGLANRIYLKPGDRLYLPFNDRKEIYVLGEVVRPLAIPFKTSAMSLTKAIGMAGGINPATSTARTVLVIRGVKDLGVKPATAYELDAHNPVAFALADNFQLHPGDVVYVGTSGVTRWNRLVSQLLPITAALNSAAAVTNATNN